MHSRKPIIYGPDGHPIVRARDRQAPAPRIGAGLEGWVSWGLIDRKGRVVKGGEQHNLILDGFLDAIATSSNHESFTFYGLRAFTTFLSHFAVGTGSTPPSVSDTALDNELGRTAVQTAYDITRASDGEYELLLEREFDFGVGNGNLTEFGFAQGVSANMLVRELFRDEGGSPITVTKTSDYKLRIRYTLTVALTPTTLTPHSFDIAGIGTINGDTTLIGNTAATHRSNDLGLFSASVASGSISSTALLSTDTSATYASAIAGQGSSGGTNRATSITRSAFVPGVHERSFDVVWGTDRGNLSGIRSISFQGDGNNASTTGVAWRMVIDPEDAFAKDSLHTLSISELVTFSWGRA